MGRFKGKLVIDQYQQHYFSGSQCRIYMDGIYIADINYIDYSIASNKAPIYSYNDPYYKVVARGNYIVQGTFSINLSDREKLIKTDTGMKMKRPSIGDDINIDPLRGSDSLLRYFDNSSAIDMNKIIKKYENAYWGSNNKAKRYNRPDEWDLLSNGDLDPDGFDVVMIFGYPHGSNNQFTIKQINDIHITGESMVTADNGQPIQLQYQYFARKIDGEATIFQEEKPDTYVDKPMNLSGLSNIDYTNTPIYVDVYDSHARSPWIASLYFHPDNDGLVMDKLYIGDIRTFLARTDSPSANNPINSDTVSGGESSITYMYYAPTANTESITFSDMSATMHNINDPSKIFTSSNFILGGRSESTITVKNSKVSSGIPIPFRKS